MLDFANFQLGIIACSIKDTEFLKVIAHKLEPEDFKNVLANKIYTWVRDYYIQYKKAPDEHIYELLEQNTTHLKKADVEDYEFFLDRAYDAKANKDFLITNIGEYLKRLAIERAIDEANILKEEHKLDDAIQVLRNSFNAGLDVNDFGLDFLADKSRYIRRALREDALFSTMLPHVDAKLGGGFRRKWLVMIAATMKRGKSWGLLHLTRAALLQGKNVLHLTLEMPKEEVQDRLDMMCGSLIEYDGKTPKNMVSVPFYTCGDWSSRKFCGKIKQQGRRMDCMNCEHKAEYVGTQKTKHMSLEVGKKVRSVLESVDMFGGNLIIKDFSSRKTNVDVVEGLLDDLISFKDFYTEVLVIDYPDLMSSRKSHKEKRDSLDEIYKDLKDLSKERDITTLIASQAVRGAIDKGSLSQKDIAEDIRKFAHIDLGFMLGSTVDQRLEGRVNFINAANRHGEQDWVVELLQCYSIGQFCLDGRVNRFNPEDRLVTGEE